MIKVVCGTILNESNEVFICQRKAEKSLGGFWEFPGGKLEDNEIEEDCLKRELMEELGMQVVNLRFFNSHVFDYKTFNINLISYLCDITSAEYLLHDHDKFLWINPERLLDYDLAPADIELANKLINSTGLLYKSDVQQL